MSHWPRVLIQVWWRDALAVLVLAIITLLVIMAVAS